MDYSNRYYKSIRYSFNRKRQIIDRTLDELHNIQLDMIDEAVASSDCREARELIQWIMAK